MKKILTLLAFVSVCLTAHAQQALSLEYFYITEVGFERLKQSGDTLYEDRCLKDFSCHDFGSKKYRILTTEKIGEYQVLKMEKLDSIPLTSNPYPDDRYVVLALKFSDNKTLTYIREAKSYTREQVDNMQISSSELDRKFGYTYYTKEYLLELSKRKQLSSKEEVEKLMKLFENPEYKAIVEKYKNTETGDIYGSGLGYELFYKAIIESGYNPIYAVDTINKLMR